MSEQTPREIDKETRRLRHNHIVLEGNIDTHEFAIPNNIDYAQRMDSLARQAAQEPGKFEFGPDFYRNERDLALGSLKYNVLEQGKAREAYKANIEEAKRHYESNKQAYHMGAIAEAMMDGVHINVEQPNDVAEAINVKVLPDKN